MLDKGSDRRRVTNFTGYPCIKCNTGLFELCSDSETALKTLVHGRLELGCGEFVEWLKTPITASEWGI